MVAARNGDQKTVEVLLARRARAGEPDLDAVDDSGWTALMFAADSGHALIVRALCEAGANTEVRCKIGRTALMQAVSAEQLDAMAELISQGADIDAQDEQGCSALLYAALGANPEPIITLREANADMELPDSSGYTVLMSAVQGAQTQIVLALLQPIPGKPAPEVDRRDDMERTPIMLAASEGMFEAIRALIDHGASCNAVDINGETALHIAARFGYTDALRVLLNAGADWQMLNNNDESPLDLARAFNRFAAVNMLTAQQRMLPAPRVQWSSRPGASLGPL
jgi:ankyrin repeat protein